MEYNQPLNWTLINQMAAAMTQQQRDDTEWRIRNNGKIHMGHFQISIGCLFALASFAFVGRIGIRFFTRHRVLLDDGLLALSFVCLAAATAIFYVRARVIYLVFTVLRGDLEASLIASQELNVVYDELNWSFAYITFLWTSIFSVKLCYLAFFHTLIRSMGRRLRRYYWIAIVMTVVSWIFLVLQQLILCPYFGASSYKCFPSLPISNALHDFTTWIGPILDGLTDIGIVSIPIIVLRRSQMALLNKIGLGIFLCLSIVMLACSIIRAAGTYYGNTLDTPWQVYWLHAQGCIAVLMASITAYRTLLVNSDKISGKIRKHVEKALHIRSPERLMEPESRTRRAQLTRFLLLRIPNATLTGLITLFAETEHPHGNKSTNGINMTTDFSMTTNFENTGYHHYLKDSQFAGPPTTTSGTTVCPQQEMGSDQSLRTRSHEEPKEEESRPGRVAAFFLRLFFLPSHGPILQHRTIGTRQRAAGKP